MSQTFRHPDILEIARREGKVTVEQLAEHFGVTLQTIRRDLTELAEANKLERVHGGAILPSGTTNIEYEERRNLNETAKLAIARACAAHIPEGCSVFLNIGTSTEAVARQLLRHQDLLLVTNNMNVAQIFSENTHSKTIVTGGALRRTDNGLVGTVAIDTIADVVEKGWSARLQSKVSVSSSSIFRLSDVRPWITTVTCLTSMSKRWRSAKRSLHSPVDVFSLQMRRNSVARRPRASHRFNRWIPSLPINHSRLT